MALIKTIKQIDEEEEARRDREQANREQEKAEVHRIRVAIVECLGGKGEEHTSEEIKEALEEKGINLGLGSMSAKLNRMADNGHLIKQHGLGRNKYLRRYCPACDKPLEVEDKPARLDTGDNNSFIGHEDCVRFSKSIHDHYGQQVFELEKQLGDKAEENTQLLLECQKLEKEIKELKKQIAMLTPAPSPSPTHRRINLE